MSESDRNNFVTDTGTEPGIYFSQDLAHYLQIFVEGSKLVQMWFKVQRIDFNQETIEILGATCPNGHALLPLARKF